MVQNKKAMIIAASVLVVLIAVFAAVTIVTRPETNTSLKNITVQIIMADGSAADFEAQTNAEYLGTVLIDEMKIVEGEKGKYGLFIKTANGQTADDSKLEWWRLTKGGEDVMTHVDSTPIYDGDRFELTFTVGYENH